MSDKLSTKFTRGGKIRESHGGYSYMGKGLLPANRKHVLSYLIASRQGIVEDHGGEDKMSASQIIILDRVVSKLGCIRLMEEHARENGVFSKGEIQPCLKQHYLAFSNSLRRDLESLKDLNVGNSKPQRTVLDIIKEFDDEKAKHNPGDKLKSKTAHAAIDAK